MYIVAGAPGSGKSTLLPLSAFGVAFFNADDEAAKRNQGSYLKLSQALRSHVNADFATFVANSIERQQSFCIETTLRTDITLTQAKLARDRGFFVEMFYIATESIEINLERVISRAKGGGHSAPEAALRRIHSSSYQTLATAIGTVGRALDRLTIFDNSVARGDLVFSFQLSAAMQGPLSLRLGHLPRYLRPFYEQALSRL